ncbi:pantothenate kinase [Baaleninema simplex]|uniref:pantothenate kinase n=1 Tax=Baaleninema simplex TaxID=2862350 RepID=UPI00034A64E2|nr:pantothenate kinase [Baaleninema simplex]
MSDFSDSIDNRRPWLALGIGNSRLHWARFEGDNLVITWNTPHLDAEAIDRLQSSQFDFSPWGVVAAQGDLRLVVASVVPDRLKLWRSRVPLTNLSLDNVPLRGLYPTLGIDRALAVLGAGTRYGFPVLLVDGGTALTLTGIGSDRTLVGGAILPGLGLQIRTLARETGALPEIARGDDAIVPQRWAKDTHTAIQSGITYTVLAGLRDFIEAWWQDYPNTPVVLTGGDGERLKKALIQRVPAWTPWLHDDPHALFLGIQATICRPRTSGGRSQRVSSDRLDRTDAL